MVSQTCKVACLSRLHVRRVLRCDFSWTWMSSHWRRDSLSLFWQTVSAQTHAEGALEHTMRLCLH